ncbi:MAG: uroporphyrinogen decarboxylase family protein [Thermoproteota archaeon]
MSAFELNMPDRCPIMHSPLPSALIKYGDRLLNIFKRYPQDFGSDTFFIPKPEDLSPEYRRGIHKDRWGTVWQSTIDGVHGTVREYPLRTWEDLDHYEFPPLPNDRDIEHLKQEVTKLRSRNLFVNVGFEPGNYFERMQWLRGFENLIVEFTKPTRHLYELADRLLDYCIESLNLVLQAKPDSVGFADDWGTQRALMVNPEFWRSFFKPRYEKMFKIVRDHGAYVQFHSDGVITDIILDLSEIGVNAIIPQFSCHDLHKMADLVRGRLCVISDLDRQFILPRGTASQVVRYVRKVIELFGYRNDGGLVGRGEIGVDVPLSNVEAMYRAFSKYGRYRWNKP